METYNKGIMTPEGKFKKAFLAKVKKECKPVAILQYKQDSTTVKGFPLLLLYGTMSLC